MRHWRLGWWIWTVSMLVGAPQSGLAQTAPTDGSAAPDPADAAPGAPTPPPDTNDEAARRHFRLGQAYYQNGQFAEAAREFEQAYELSRRAPLLYNVYLAHRDALHTRQSYEALRRYLEEVPDPPDEDHLRARLQHLEAALAANPEEQDPEVEPEQTPSQTDQEPVTPPVDLTVPAAEPEGRSPVPYIVMGVGGGALVGGLVAGLLSRGARSDLDALCAADGACPPDSNWESLRDRGRRSARAADALIGVGAAAAVTGVVLYFVMSPDDDDPDATASASPLRGGVGCDTTGCMATFGGQF
ncbi:MAG: tetratricopeptide repeat protein [Polyangiales bacterium]|nr:tetratricopeptide repeat protein [Myxococcales bacterium]